jgi:hypothetical protein
VKNKVAAELALLEVVVNEAELYVGHPIPFFGRFARGGYCHGHPSRFGATGVDFTRIYPCDLFSASHVDELSGRAEEDGAVKSRRRSIVECLCGILTVG